MSKYQINILHLYPDLLNLYGDNGNIAALYKRLLWRDIDVNILRCLDSDEVPDLGNIDIIFLGGGSDREQEIVCDRLRSKKDAFKEYIENNGVLIAACGGYPLLGTYYQTAAAKIEGLGLLDIYTDLSEKRLISDVVLNSELADTPIVGFENHAEITYIQDYKPLGKVVYGHGNTTDGGFEGVVYKNVIGTYLHGPLLPKNPALCDYILSCALKNKYPDFNELSSLDDKLEKAANKYMVDRFVK